MSKSVMRKEVIHQFGEHYLLGEKDGIKYYLEEPSWDCGWYWGFGYIHSYTNNRCPEMSRDIASHTHFDYEYLRNGNYNAFMDLRSPFTEAEKWRILELMSTAYKLRESAALFGSGKSNFTENPLVGLIKDETLAHKINAELLPAVFKEIKSILY